MKTTVRPVATGYGDRDIWRIALPMIISSVTTPLLGLVDTAVVGHLDQPQYLGAVAAGATIFSVLFMGLNFLRMGTTGITAQAFGAGDGDGARRALGQALVVALLLAALLIAVRGWIIELAVAALDPGAAVAALAREYFAVRIWSAPATLAGFVLIGWLIGMQDARGPLAMTLATNLVNIVLDIWFVHGLGLQVRGVALATLLAEFTGLAVGLAYVAARLARHPGRWQAAQLVHPGSYRRFAGLNADLLLRTLALMFVLAFITAQGARLGDLVLAANAVLLNFQYFSSYALDGIAHAAEALAGKAIGAGDRAALARMVRRALRWTLLLAGGFTLAWALFGTGIIALLTSIDAVRATAGAYLPWLVLLPLVSAWSFLYDGVFIGATWSREMRQVMLAAALLVFLPAWLLARPLGNHALWLAFTLFMAARGIGMGLWYRRLAGGDDTARRRMP